MIINVTRGNIEITMEAGDGLSGQSWQFSIMDYKLRFRLYATWERPSKRHKPRFARLWDSYYKRDATIKRADIPEVEKMAEVAVEAYCDWLRTNVQFDLNDE